MFRKLLTAVIAVSLVLVVTPVTRADDKDDVNPTVFGKTYSEWTAEWWIWAVAGPDGENAVQDETGEFCDANQPDGPVWFLAGTFGVPGVERACTIPEDRALFYPLVNSVWTDCPPPLNDEDLTDEEVRAIMATFGGGGDTACQLTSHVDGEELLGFLTSNSLSSLQIVSVRIQSPRFSIPLPENHISDPGCCAVLDPDTGDCLEPLILPPGPTDRRSISEGYWAMVPPLSAGEHMLTLHGAGCDPGTGAVFFETGVTYHLTVLGDDDNDD